MIRLRAMNTRVKDLWDIACLPRRFAFDGETLRKAIEETFRRRRTSVAGKSPAALNTGYYEDTIREQRWQVLLKRIERDDDGPTLLVDAGEELVRFLSPICDSLIADQPFTQIWPAGGPWQPGLHARTGDEGP